MSSGFTPILLSDQMEATSLRIVLLGKTGSGKSSFGNALIGKKVFEENDSVNSGTSECKAVTKENGEITVIDTPGFFDNRMSRKKYKSEIIKIMIECSPGPHAFLIFLKVEKYTEQEIQVIKKIKKLFFEGAFKHAVLVFTHGDDLNEAKKIKEFVSESKDLKELLDKCGGRCHVVDNKYWNNNQQDSNRNNQFQIRQLLKTINEMVKQNGGGCYTNELLQKLERNIVEEEKKTGSREEAKKNVTDAFLKKTDNIAGKVLLGALLGVPAMVAVILSAVFGLVTGAAKGAAGGVVGVARAFRDFLAKAFGRPVTEELFTDSDED